VTDDTRYDDYFAAALDADAHADQDRRIEALRSLRSEVEAHIAGQNLPPDLHESELALARAAAEKLISDMTGDFSSVAAAAAMVAAAAATPKHLHFAMPKITPKRVLIALGCLLIYILPLAFFLGEGRELKSVDAKGAEVGLTLSIGVTALHDEKISLHIKPVSGSLMDKEGHLTQEVTLRLDPGTGPVTHTFAANGHLTPWDVNIIAVSGDILEYPFDRYHFEVDIEGKASGKPIAVEAGLGTIPHGIRARLTDIRELGGTADVSISVRRSGSVIFLAALSTISLLVVALAALSVAWQVAEQGRRIDFSMMTWVAAFMFVIPAVRNSLPGAPPIGALIDFLLFFWLQVLAAAATTTLVVIWMKQRPAKG
jgi:hypothetical protein